MAAGMATGTRRWSRRRLARLGLALFLPFPAMLVLWVVVLKALPSAIAGYWASPLIVIMLPFSFVSTAGFILLFAAWVMPPSEQHATASPREGRHGLP